MIDIVYAFVAQDTVVHFAEKWNINLKSSLSLFFSGKIKTLKDEVKLSYGDWYTITSVEEFFCVRDGRENIVLNLPVKESRDILIQRMSDILEIEVEDKFDKSQEVNCREIVKSLMLTPDEDIYKAFALIQDNVDYFLNNVMPDKISDLINLYTSKDATCRYNTIPTRVKKIGSRRNKFYGYCVARSGRYVSNIDIPSKAPADQVAKAVVQYAQKVEPNAPDDVIKGIVDVLQRSILDKNSRDNKARSFYKG